MNENISLKDSQIGFDGVVDEAPLFSKAFPNATFFTFNKRWCELSNRQNLLEDDIYSYQHQCKFRYLKYAQIDRLIGNDKHLYQKIYENAVTGIIKNNIKIYITSGAAYLYQFSVMEACEDLGISHLSIFNIPANRASYMFSLGLGDRFYFGQSTKGIKIEFGEVFYSEFHYYNNAAPWKLYLKEFFSRTLQYAKEKTRKDYMTQFPSRQGLRYLKKFYRKKRMKVPSVNVNVVDIVIPLQVIPEAAYDILCSDLGEFSDALKEIAKRYPKLVFGLREHPHMEGMRPKSFWTNLPQNMVKLDPLLKKEELLDGNNKILCFNSTFFLESLKAGNPTCFLGNAFYGNFFKNHHIKISQLNNFVMHSEQFCCTHDKFIDFEARCSNSYEGLFTVCRSGFELDVLNQDNILKFRTNVLSFICDLEENRIQEL